MTDLHDTVRFNVTTDPSNFNISSDELIVLVSFAGLEDSSAMDATPQPRRIYALVSLSYVAGAFQVIERKVQKVPYQSVCVNYTFGHVQLHICVVRRQALEHPCTLGFSSLCAVASSRYSLATPLSSVPQVSRYHSLLDAVFT